MNGGARVLSAVVLLVGACATSSDPDPGGNLVAAGDAASDGRAVTDYGDAAETGSGDASYGDAGEGGGQDSGASDADPGDTGSGGATLCPNDPKYAAAAVIEAVKPTKVLCPMGGSECSSTQCCYGSVICVAL